MVRTTLNLMILWLLLTLAGCSMLMPETSHFWSENYALDKNGGQCTIPEMNDGDKETSGRLGVHAVGKRVDAVGSAGVYDTELKIQPEVVVRFQQRRPIDRIVIYAKNLDHFDVYWRDEQKQWHPLKSVRDNRKTRIVINAHAVTDAIRIHAQPQQSIRPMRTVMRSPSQPFELLLEAEISEIEVYARK